MSDVAGCGRLTDVGRAVLRQTQSDLRMQVLRSRKLSLKLRKTRAAHKAEIELLQAELAAARQQLMQQRPDVADRGSQTESTAFRESQSTQVEMEQAAGFCFQYGSIYDEISRTLPDFSLHERQPKQSAPSCIESFESVTGPTKQKEAGNDVQRAIEDIKLELGDCGVPVQRAFRKTEMPAQHERQVEEISLLHCKRVSSVLENAQPSRCERVYAVDRKPAANEPSSVSDDYFIRSIEEAAQREHQAARAAVLRPAAMQQSLWQRLSDSGQLHVSRGRIGAGQ